MKTFSGGMRRRLDLAASLVAVPEVLFLDEPTTGLDPRSRNDLWDLLRDLVRDGTTIILTTQYLEEADQLADDIVVLDHGRTVAHGTPDELKPADRQRPHRRHGAVGRRARRTSARALERVRLRNARRSTRRAGRHRPDRRRRALMDVMRALDAAGVDAVDLNRRQATLDDVFLTLTDSGSTDPTRRRTRCRHDHHPRAHRPERRAALGRPRRPSGQPGHRWWSDTLVFAGRNIEHIRQIPEKLLDVTLQPLMFVLLFAYVFGGAIAVGGGNYREYLIGGILIQSLAFGMTGPATAIATDLTEGVIDRFRSLPAIADGVPAGPLPRRARRHGRCRSSCCSAPGSSSAGAPTPTSATSPARVLLLLLFASAMIWIGTWIGLMVRSPDAVMGVGFIVVFPLTFLSSAFVPINSLPTVLQWVAAWNPVSVMVAAVRELFGNPSLPTSVHTWPLDHPVPAAFLYCFVLLAIAVPASLRRYRARTSD